MALKQLGPLQKGTIDSFEFAAYNFRGGINVKAVPQFVADEDLIVGLNGYLRADGGFQSRNGITKYHASPGSHGQVQGLARFYQTIRNGSIVTENKATLMQLSGVLWNADTNTSIGNIGTNNALPWTTVNALDADDPNYGSGPTQVLIMCTGSGGPYVYDGTNLYTPSGWSNAGGARWCAIVNGIVYFGGISAHPYTVYGTGDGIIDSFETLPGYRVFQMTQPVNGLCAFGTGATASLVVGMNQGLCSIYGTGPDNYVVQDVPAVDGVMAGRSMIYENGLVYFLGSQAIYTFDGFNPPVQISQKIEPWILNDSFVEGYPMTAADRQTSFGFVYKNRYHVGYGSNSDTLNTILVYDLVVRGWTVVQTTPGINCASTLNAPTDSDPFLVVVGSSSASQVYNWDVEPTVGDAASDDGTAILVQFQTKFFKVGVPGTNKAMMRVYPELFISSTFQGTWVLDTDYGGTSYTNPINTTLSGNSSLWGTAVWGDFDWASGAAFQPYNAPASRIDYPGSQGESFSFGMITNALIGPWIFAGLSGAYSQRGRT